MYKPSPQHEHIFAFALYFTRPDIKSALLIFEFHDASRMVP